LNLTSPDCNGKYEGYNKLQNGMISTIGGKKWYDI